VFCQVFFTLKSAAFQHSRSLPRYIFYGAQVKQSAVARLESLKVTPRIDTLFKVLTPMGYKLAIVPKEQI
jgi:hypothetical protein